MFWKTGSWRGSRRWSIARRLALLHIAAVFISYALFGSLFYLRRVSQQRKHDVAELMDEVAGVQAMLRQPDGRELIDQELNTQIFEPDTMRPFLRIIDAQGTVVRESPGMSRVLPVGVFTTKASLVKGMPWRNEAGDYYLLASVPAPENPLSGRGGTLQVALSAREEQMFGTQLRYALFFFVGSGTIFAFACAYFVVRLGLQPLEDISRTARSITKRQLDTRIDDAPLPTELVSLAHSFNSMMARLEESFDKLSHYSSNLAHELRTPINTLMITAEIALSKERQADDYRAVIASSLEECGRLSRLIDRMLFLARADIQQYDLILQPLDVTEELENLFDYYAEEAGEAGVDLAVRGMATVHADPDLFRSALSNLLRNALAYTGSGGSITVGTWVLPNGTVNIAVKDTGTGIPPQHLPRIFDRFYRPDEVNKPHGSGLGLAIVKAIMNLHGGDIAIESIYGRGTTVTLSFPQQVNPRL
ncbi:heavy metal sensor histidine kinase [Geomesophilobacter sediminis]|uniref:histidine kinase n=1 Tax=Geomesophilobacter sediminis TaxID=2798584 RepID=A0A8J7IPV3_9BACT|nr:heavy metal sensor histidine kinase [Geomesophilobacter sediminis]MBJ6725718.1 heavy metal sensor histidine kinase [Geomesophilobacter sediminis]